jgi:hypothetical protein
MEWIYWVPLDETLPTMVVVNLWGGAPLFFSPGEARREPPGIPSEGRSAGEGLAGLNNRKPIGTAEPVPRFDVRWAPLDRPGTSSAMPNSLKLSARTPEAAARPQEYVPKAQ